MEGATYSEILHTIEKSFVLSPITLLPVLVVIALIVWKKPTIPTFVAGIAVAAFIAMLLQGVTLKSIMNFMYSGFSVHTDSAFVDKMLNRGGFTSMLSTIGLLMAAAIFGAPLRTAGVAQVLLDYVTKFAKNSRVMCFGVMCLHTLFFMITGAYYVSYPVVGSMTKDMFPKYKLHRKEFDAHDVGYRYRPCSVGSLVYNRFLHGFHTQRRQYCIHGILLRCFGSLSFSLSSTL